MRQWVDKKSKEQGRPWSTLPKFSDDEIKLIKGSIHITYNTLYSIIFKMKFKVF